MTKIIDLLKKYTDGKQNTEKVEISVLQLNRVIKALEQETCEMTAEEYRQRMIQAFHNAGTDELIAVCVLPTEKEFEHLEWLLKNHYKKAPSEDAISRQSAIDGINQYFHNEYYQRTSIQDCRDCLIEDVIKPLPSVTPQPKTGHWTREPIRNEKGGCIGAKMICSECNNDNKHDEYMDYCPNCGARMVESEDKE